MKLKQTIAALAGAALLAAMPMSAYTYTAFAETDAFYTGSDASGQVETFTSGDYTYSLLTGKEDAMPSLITYMLSITRIAVALKVFTSVAASRRCISTARMFSPSTTRPP